MHIGNRIKEEVSKKGISITDFAKLIKKVDHILIQFSKRKY